MVTSAAPIPATIYSIPHYPETQLVQEFFRVRGIPYVEKDVTQDPLAYHEMVQRSRQAERIPVTIFADQVIIGFDRARLERILRDRSQGRPAFGARVADAARITMRTGRIPIFGAYVGRVAPGSPAEKIGLQEGDIITEMNIRPVLNADDVEKALAPLKFGNRLSVVYVRGERSQRGEIVL